jgi:hypothetical protein
MVSTRSKLLLVQPTDPRLLSRSWIRRESALRSSHSGGGWPGRPDAPNGGLISIS